MTESSSNTQAKWQCIYCERGIDSVPILYRINKGELPAKHVCHECNQIHHHVIDSEVKEISETIAGVASDSRAETYIPLEFDVTNPVHVEVIRRVIPDMRKIDHFVNPIHQVSFMAGMLAMREMVLASMRNIADGSWAANNPNQALPPTYEALILAAWPTDWLGEDPGTPRFIDWSTAKEQIGEDEWADVKPTPSQEALGDAFKFLKMIGVDGNDSPHHP